MKELNEVEEKQGLSVRLMHCNLVIEALKAKRSNNLKMPLKQIIFEFGEFYKYIFLKISYSSSTVPAYKRGWILRAESEWEE